MSERKVAPPPWFPLTDEEFFQKGIPNTDRLHKFLADGGKLSSDHVIWLNSEVSKIMKEEPNLIYLFGTFVVVGDIHGQYYDMHELLLREWKNPIDEKSPKWIFLGDYVDRGPFGLETILLLFAYKIRFPKNIYLLRGNHETRSITAKFNFKEECTSKYSIEMYSRIMDSFDTLPLACVLSTSSGNYLAVHGGISSELPMLDDFNGIDRFTEPGKSGPLCDLIWSDPLGEDTAENLNEQTMKEWMDVEFCENPTRGVGQVYGHKAIMYFLGDNGLDAIIRAHEVAPTGYIENYMCDKGRKLPFVVTVFSAPNYCGWYNNTGAIMILKEEGGYEYKHFEEIKAPFVLPAHLNGFSYTLPWIAKHTHKFVTIFFGLLIDQLAENSIITETLRKKIKLIDNFAEQMKRVEEKNDAALKLKGLMANHRDSELDVILKRLSSGKITYKEIKDIDIPLEKSPLVEEKVQEVITTNPSERKQFWQNKIATKNSLLIDSNVCEVYDEIRDNNTKTNWGIFTYLEDPNLSSQARLVLKSKGTNGIDGILSNLLTTEIAYIYFRSSRKNNPQDKFVLIFWVPEYIQPKKKKDVVMHKGFIKDVFKNFSLEIHATEYGELNETKIVEKLDKISSGYSE